MWYVIAGLVAFVAFGGRSGSSSTPTQSTATPAKEPPPKVQEPAPSGRLKETVNDALDIIDRITGIVASRRG